MKTEIHERAQALESKLISYRRDFHRYPEAGWTEFRSSAIIAKTLEQLGYTIRLGKDIIKRTSMMGIPTSTELENCMQRAISEGADPQLVEQMAGGLTGVVADMRFGDGPLLVLRFDIDANDICEAQDDRHRPFAEHFSSVHDRVMHACGHDGHISLGLGVAELLVHFRDRFTGAVRLVFQPSEEGVRGAGPMVDAGVLDGADFILGGHIGFLAKQNRQFVCGTEKFLATTKFDVSFAGTPAHAGGAPEQGNNALLAAAAAALNLHAISRHSQGASRITVGRMEAGQGRNIIPPDALIKVETRGETSEIDDFMFSHAQKVIAGAAVMYGVDYQLTLMGQTKSGKSDHSMIERIRRVAEDIDYFDKNLLTEMMTMTGSEDFSHMMTRVQQSGGSGSYFVIGTEIAAGHHDFYFDFDEHCLAPGVEFITRMVYELLGK